LDSQAENLFNELKANSAELQVFTYGVMSLAYAKGGHVEKARALLVEMRAEGKISGSKVKCNVIIDASAYYVCRDGSQFEGYPLPSSTLGDEDAYCVPAFSSAT
jgi:pentatricopeptide repeat protein